MDEKEITDPRALVIAKAFSLISVVVACFSGVHQMLDWSLFEPEAVEWAFKASLVLMLIAMAFHGKAVSQDH